MSDQNCIILNWNARGLNNPVRRKVVRDLVKDTSSTIVCLQETKLEQIDSQIVSETLGPCFVDHFAYLLCGENHLQLFFTQKQSHIHLTRLFL
uniref:Endonuclease/exonuclease/phosphatase domain-containing protein n=1 Tax=Arundo donax TaxID=35708 RepID=A0A0A9DZN0_ARUDO